MSQVHTIEKDLQNNKYFLFNLYNELQIKFTHIAYNKCVPILSAALCVKYLKDVLIFLDQKQNHIIIVTLEVKYTCLIKQCISNISFTFTNAYSIK